MQAELDAELTGSYLRGKSYWLSHGLLPLLIVASTYGSVPRLWSIAWGAANVVILCARLMVHWAFVRADPGGDAARWAPFAWAGVLASSIVWGLASLVFLLPEAHYVHWLLGLALIGLVSGASVSVASNPRLYYTLLVLMVGPYLTGVLLQPEPMTRAAGVMVLGFAVARVFSGRRYRRGLEELFQLRQENLGLIETLRVEKQDADVARERAEQANLAKSKYLAAASHDLRQPVHALGLFMDELRHQPEGAPTPNGLVGNMGSSVDALSALLDAVLDISKLDSGMIKPDIASFRVDDQLHSLVSQHRPAAHEKGLTLRYVPCTVWARSDPTLLMRIVGNFISNAVRYTARGGILVGCRRTAAGIRIEVWDTGRGIPAVEHEAIFREFHRLDDSRRDGGMGLGLAIAERTARLLGHTLTMRSVPGRGSVFRIEVPYGTVAAEERSPAAIDERTRLHGAVVAVIDDELAILAAMNRMLMRWGCSVLTARTGDELLADVRRRNVVPDAMLVDYRLADGELGTDVIARVRHELAVDMPCHLITGDLMREHLDEFDAAGLGVLHKPVQPERLRQCLGEMLSRQAARRHYC